MHGSELSNLGYRSLWPFCRLIAGAGETSRLVELDGVLATVVPRTPERSITNSVVYERAEDLERALDRLTRIYAEAGIRAWTVWVRPGDEAAARFLAEAGHELDAEPAAMALALDGFERSPRAGLDLDPEPAAAEVGRINDEAYGLDDFGRAFERRPDGLRLYVARDGGRAVACAGAVHAGGDCGIYLVATRPEARGRGLATELMTVALNEAREAGCATASLQSTAMGKPIYLRLGFEDFGPIPMYERRAT